PLGGRRRIAPSSSRGLAVLFLPFQVLGIAAVGRRRYQRERQHLVDRGHQVHGDFLPQLRRQILVDVLRVLLRKDDFTNPDPPRDIREASMNSTSPPDGVHARPIATPGSLVRSSISSSRNLGAPSMSTTVAGVISIGVSLPSARRRATLRHSAPISRSRLRT